MNQYHGAAAYGCHSAYVWHNIGGLNGNFIRSCVAPPTFQIGEDTDPTGWGDWLTPQQPYLGQFDQKLQGPFDLGGRNVWEQTPGGSYQGKDECHFRNSLVEPFESITPSISDSNDSGLELGQWRVWASSSYGPDYVGWSATYSPNPVTYYREQGRAPCKTTFYQKMVIDCSNLPRNGSASLIKVQYRLNKLEAYIGTTTVSSTRDGKTISKTWP